jgi:hypothetical protein
VEETIVQQMGLLLTQVRVARMSLEHIERSTSRFAGLALSAAAAGTGERAAAFGAPPMIDGALKVYVVNINDLVDAAPGGGFLEPLLGGIGRAIGGFVGGLVGGVIGGVSVTLVVERLAATVLAIERVVKHLTNTIGLKPGEWKALFGNPADPAAKKEPEPPSPLMVGIGSQLERMLPEQVLAMVEAFSHIIDALIILVPVAIGAVAALLASLSDLRLQIVEWIGFALRNLLLLRAVAIGVLADTASIVAPLVASILSGVAAMADTVLSGLASLLSTAITGAVRTARILAGGLVGVINTSVAFLRDTLIPLLNWFQTTPLVRLVAWFATALPAMLVALTSAAGGVLTGDEKKDLAQASAEGAKVLATPTSAPAATTLTSATLVGSISGMDDKAIGAEMTKLSTEASKVAKDSLGAVSGLVTKTAVDLQKAAADSTTTLGSAIDKEVTAAKGHIKTIDGVMSEAQAVAGRRPESTLDKIAVKYQSWLTGGGMDEILRAIRVHFTESAKTDGEKSVPGRLIQGMIDAYGRHDVIVEVGEVLIELAPPLASATATVGAVANDPAAYAAVVAHAARRGADPNDPALGARPAALEFA